MPWFLPDLTVNVTACYRKNGSVLGRSKTQSAAARLRLYSTDFFQCLLYEVNLKVHVNFNFFYKNTFCNKFSGLTGINLKVNLLVVE